MDIWNELEGQGAEVVRVLCSAGPPWLQWAMATADGFIAAACLSVPVACIGVVRRQASRLSTAMAWLLPAFAVACAVCFAIDTWAIWQPASDWQLLARLVLAGVSAALAMALWRRIPTMLATPSVDELQAVIRSLQAEVLKLRGTEDSLADSQQSLAVTLASIGAGFMATDREGRIARMNAVAETLTGWSEAESLGQDIWTVFQREGRLTPSGSPNAVDVMLRDAVTIDKAHHVVCISRDRRRTAVEVKEALVQGADGTVRGMAMVIRDMSQLIKAEAEAGRLAAIVESSNDAIIGKTLQGIITSWNPGAARLFGYTAEEALGRPMQMLIPPDRISEEPMILARLARGEHVEHFETVRQRKDGSLVQISAMISPVRAADGRITGASKIARDITERKQADERLLAQLRRLRLLDQITRAIAERQDLQSIHQVAVRSLEEQLATDLSCVLARDPLTGALTVSGVGLRTDGQVLPPDAQLVAADLGAQGWLGDELIYEPDIASLPSGFMQRLARAGYGSVVMAPLQSDRQVMGVLLTARRAVRAFSSEECEFIRQLSAHVALATRQAQLHAALQQAFDDLQRSQQAAMQQERLRALGQMASGIAHDINNAITPAALYAEGLLEREVLSESVRASVQSIARAIDDVAATVARMREFYRGREPQLELTPVALNDMARQVIDLCRARWSDMPQQRGVVIEVAWELAPNLPAVPGVESEIREALVNLVFNAVDAMPSGGRLTMRTAVQPGGDGARRPAVVIEVDDNGVGMDEATRQRCLEPFFTTKGERGTGLGLAMVYGFTKRHGVEMRIDSATGRGTAMRLAFPLPSAAVAAAWGDAPVEAVQPRRLRILLVDDDPLLLRSLQDSLIADGHAVTTAPGGQDGIDAFRTALRGDSPFDIVITDLGMPQVDGRQVAAAVKLASASTPVMLLTGWGQGMAEEGVAPRPFDLILSKPPRLKALRAGLARLPLTGDPA